MASSSTQHSDSSDSDESLDPLSPHFDPRKALYAKSVKLPVPGAKQFNNIAEFENFMTGKDANALKKEKQNRPELPGIIAKRAAEQAKEAVRKAAIMAKSQGPSERSNTQLRRQHDTNVLTRMEKCEKGPMSLLRRCIEERCRIVVIVRAAVAVKSRCRGYLVAFDKHLNMALMDVDETFLRPVKKEKNPSTEVNPQEQAMEKLSTETENLRFGSEDGHITHRHPNDALFSGKPPTDMSIGSCNGDHKKDKGPIYNSNSEAQASSFQGDKYKTTESRQEESCSHGVFWTKYKAWAERRSYTKYEIVERHVNQLFLRGDNVVSVILDQT